MVVYQDYEQRNELAKFSQCLHRFFSDPANESLRKEALAIMSGYAKKESTVDWIDEWLELFPKGYKTNGKPVRSDRKMCQKKMEAFIKDYPYSKDLIMTVTSHYIENKLREDKLIRCATYLISHKDDGSDLAALCANYDDKPTKTEGGQIDRFFI